MRISYQNEPLYPHKPADGGDSKKLYYYYEQSDQARPLTSCVHWFDFHTRNAHTLTVSYPDPFYKLVLCLEGNSRSVPKGSQAYAFRTGQMLFYQTEQEPYPAVLPADTRFKLIHIHLSKAHTAMLQNEVPGLFDKPAPVLRLSPECTQAFWQLKQIASISPGLLRLFEEKLITDQLFGLAAQYLPPTSGKDIVQEALWHIHRAVRYLTINELAQLTGTNTFRLKQVFRDQLRTSVFQYQANLHLERAAQWLLDTPLTVSEVALQCGYNSPAAFSNAFMKKHGLRPQAFKNSRSR